MKTINIILSIAATIFLLNSCGKESVTYRFTDEDKPKLLSHYTEGKILTYINEIGEERKFKIGKVEQRLETQDWIYRYCEGAGYAYFYCEPKFIHFTDLETQVTFYLSLSRFPINMQKASIDNTQLQPSSLFAQFHIEDGWWDSHYYYFRFFFNLNEPVITVTCDEVNFDNVIVTTNYSTEGNGGALLKTKTTYYDIFKGLVGFDDYFGNQWRLKNEKQKQ
jgi:hypothetical protein